MYVMWAGKQTALSDWPASAQSGGVRLPGNTDPDALVLGQPDAQGPLSGG